MSFHFHEFNPFGGRRRPSLDDAQRAQDGVLSIAPPCDTARDCLWRARRGPAACAGCALGVASPYIETLESTGSSSPPV
ncbi:hypothetical protein [Actibacterium sp. 188UL27-1]|uniref:hypothetical protein n=1 Tax=Actibacterium sp. 188UL27-1 TaxID=2786961 RepID=UPI0019566CFA|nr:hypothetical protein [Actibacterium sp. 188UL27-1]MBM7066627.1 hypothetical protein [Actibacterium sp. 188UL27-1]